MSTRSIQSATPGNLSSPVSTPLPNKVDQVFQTVINQPPDTTTTSLGVPSDIDTLLLGGTERIKHLESIPVIPEETATKENCLQLINQAQKALEEIYQLLPPDMPTQGKIDRLKVLEDLFYRLNQVHSFMVP